MVAAVVVLDQVTKWWGWRHAHKAVINPGGTWWIERTAVSNWLSAPGTGALLNLLGCAVLGLAAFALLRRRRSVAGLVSGALMIAGWSSNLLDRLGMHDMTAPGSGRGAVDFIHLGPVYYNVADLFIASSAVLFLAAACARTGRRHRATRRLAATPPRPDGVAAPGGARASAAALGLVVAVAGRVDVAIGAGRDLARASSSRPRTNAGCWSSRG